MGISVRDGIQMTVHVSDGIMTFFAFVNDGINDNSISANVSDGILMTIWQV